MSSSDSACAEEEGDTVEDCAVQMTIKQVKFSQVKAKLHLSDFEHKKQLEHQTV